MRRWFEVEHVSSSIDWRVMGDIVQDDISCFAVLKTMYS